jgi:uncharacterized damage-inducible protein DinB
LINLLRALPKDSLEIRAMEGSPSIGELFGHMHYVRLVFVSEDAPEAAAGLPENDLSKNDLSKNDLSKNDLPKNEWAAEPDSDRMAKMLNDSATAVRNAVKGRLEAGRAMDLHYDHPILLLQHMLWHEGYHHGQIKLALKLAGRAIPNEVAGPVTWGVWMRKNKPPTP